MAQDRKSMTIEDVMKHKAKTIGGQAMTPAAKQRAEMAGKVKLLEERAEILGISPANYMSGMRSGKFPPIDGLPSNYNPSTSESNEQSFAFETSAPNMNIVDNKKIPNSVNFLDMIDSDAASEPIYTKIPDPPKKEIKREVQKNLDHLINPIWSDIETLLKFEQLVSCLIDLKIGPNKITEYQKAIEKKGLIYLDEILKRMQWRCLYIKNRMQMNGTTANIDFPKIIRGMKMYESKLYPMDYFGGRDEETSIDS